MDGEEVRDRLRHMQDAIAAIERLTGGKTLDEYRRSPDMAAAVERYLERLSEASRHIPESLLSSYPEIPWRRVADIGNVLRHAYEQLSDRRIWATVTRDLPPLKSAVEAMARSLEDGTDEP